MYKRYRHRHIAQFLSALDGELLRHSQCLFGGGTVIALRYGEYRESADVDFLVSDLACYRKLRELIRSADDISPLLREGVEALPLTRPVRTDQYGIRTSVDVGGESIKFEIVLEGRIELDKPGVEDALCGVPTLRPLDMAASKLLANSDRWLDASVFSRDIIDLAMIDVPMSVLRAAVLKAEGAYGSSILRDLGKAIVRLGGQQGLLERCMQAMAVDVPKALLWQRMRRLERLL